MDKELLQAMQTTEVKPGMKVRHKASGKIETVISLFKSKEGGTWHDAVLYQGIDSNTGEMATFGRDMGDFLANFEPAEGTVLGDDLPFTSEGEPFTSKSKEGRNCENCHWLRIGGSQQQHRNLERLRDMEHTHNRHHKEMQGFQGAPAELRGMQEL